MITEHQYSIPIKIRYLIENRMAHKGTPDFWFCERKSGGPKQQNKLNKEWL